jgi:hypothetical protein
MQIVTAAYKDPAAVMLTVTFKLYRVQTRCNGTFAISSVIG